MQNANEWQAAQRERDSDVPEDEAIKGASDEDDADEFEDDEDVDEDEEDEEEGL